MSSWAIHKVWCSRHQFTSGEFKDFRKSHQINHVTAAPFHLRSSGQAERFVDTLKWALKKLGQHQLKKPFNNSFSYIGLLRIIKHQLHNHPPRWCLHVEYGLCTTNYNLNRRSQEEQTSYQQNAIIPEKKPFSEFLKTIDLFRRRVRSREELGIWCTL